MDLKRDIQGLREERKGILKVKGMQLQLRSGRWDLNAFHRDLVGRVVRACDCDRLLHVEHRLVTSNDTSSSLSGTSEFS